MGLLDDIRANRLGLLQGSQALLQAGAPSTQRTTAIGGLGRGLLGFGQGSLQQDQLENQQSQQKIQQQLQQAQLQQAQGQLGQQEATQQGFNALGAFRQAGADTGIPVTQDEMITQMLQSPSRQIQKQGISELSAQNQLDQKLAAATAKSKVTSTAKRLEKEFKNTKALRGEFTKATSNFASINDSFGRISVSAKDPSAAGDLSLIFNYMKMLDPESVVRESEFATAAATASLMERAKGVYTKMTGGRRLSDAQRKDFVDRSKLLFKEADRIHGGRRKQFEGLAKRAGLDPANVVFQRNFAQDPEGLQTPQTLQGQGTEQNPMQITSESEADNLPAGTVVIINGRKAIVE